MVALSGGSSLFELGPATEVECFFECARRFTPLRAGASLLLDRLYKRYVPIADLPRAAEELAALENTFERVGSSLVDWNAIGIARESNLDLAKPTLSGVFANYFEAFAHCAESAWLNFVEFKAFPGYQEEPVRIVPTDEPWLTAELKRPLAEYDALDGPPFWKPAKEQPSRGRR